MALTACSNVPRELEVVTAPIDILLPEERPVIPPPRPIKLEPVEWTTVSPNKMPSGEDWEVVGMTRENYIRWQRNQNEIARYVLQAQRRLKYYSGDEDFAPTKAESPKRRPQPTS